MLGFRTHFLCECCKNNCFAEIEITEQSLSDFLEYVDQRDKYCLISKSCSGKPQISKNRIAVEGDDYWILESHE